MKKMVSLLIVQAISCLIVGWALPLTIFVTLTLAIWFLIFSYVFFKIRKSTPKPEVNDKLHMYLMVICTSALFSPVVCLFLNLIYPLIVMNKYYRFMCFHKNGVHKKTGLDVSMNTPSQISSTHYPGFYEQGTNCFETHQTLDTSFVVNAEVDVSKDFGGQLDNPSVTFSDVNPASGLPMIGNVDVTGNPYGIDRRD